LEEKISEIKETTENVLNSFNKEKKIEV